jgi:putative transposase
MGRALRAADAGYAYHVLNRANARLPRFRKDPDFEAFERVLAEACQRYAPRLLAYGLLPNHWQLVLWPAADGLLSRFVGWLTLTHTQRYHAHYHSAGGGHLYQGRFKSFPVEAEAHFLTVCRYVERNALRAGLVRRAEPWRWGSLWRRHTAATVDRSWLSAMPVPCPAAWAEEVNAPQSEEELEDLRRCVQRGQPYGGARWVKATAAKLALETTFRPRGRPRKENKGSFSPSSACCQPRIRKLASELPSRPARPVTGPRATRSFLICPCLPIHMDKNNLDCPLFPRETLDHLDWRSTFDLKSMTSIIRGVGSGFLPRSDHG